MLLGLQYNAAVIMFRPCLGKATLLQGLVAGYCTAHGHACMKFRNPSNSLPQCRRTSFRAARFLVPSTMADYEFALSSEPSVQDLSIVWAPETGLPTIQTRKSEFGVLAKYKLQDILQEKNLVDGLYVPPLDQKKQRKLALKDVKETKGHNWFNMPSTTITSEVKRDLQLLTLRNVTDPKQHYKKNDTKGVPKFFQVGRYVEGPTEFYSARLTKKQRKETFADEFLANSQLKAYRKRKYNEIQEQKQQGGKNFYKQKKNRQKPSFAMD